MKYLLVIGSLAALITIVFMFKDMKKLFYYFLAAFDGFSKGASTNKVVAAAGVGVAIYITKRFTNDQNILSILVAWLLFVLLCLGIVLFKQVTELVNSYKFGNNGKTVIDDKETLDKHLDTTVSAYNNGTSNPVAPVSPTPKVD